MSPNSKGYLALSKVVANLAENEYDVFLPMNDTRCDLLCIKNNIVSKIQVKHSKNGVFHKYSVANSGKAKYYTNEEIDFFAVYLSEIDIVVYVPFNSDATVIRYKQTNSSCDFWWYKDFLVISQEIREKRKENTIFEPKYNPKIGCRKVKNRPSKEELEKLVWELPTSKIAIRFNVSDKAIEKWCKTLNIAKPGRGYWQKMRN